MDRMTGIDVEGSGTPADPWILFTPPGTSEFEAYRDPDAEPPALVVRVGTTELRYHLRCVEDLHEMLVADGDWMLLGNADEQKTAKPDTVEAWGRSVDNPVGGWYGLKKGLRGRFGNYVPPVLEVLGLVELEHSARNNRVRARELLLFSRSTACGVVPLTSRANSFPMETLNIAYRRRSAATRRMGELSGSGIFRFDSETMRSGSR